jgi:hypothetical protein
MATSLSVPQNRPAPGFELVPRVRRHWQQLRRDGVSKTLRADLRRSRRVLRRYAWLATHNYAPRAVPVYVVGVQRSGTEMLLFTLAECPAAEIHNESDDSRAFSNWALRDDGVVRSIVESSRSRWVIFKPLCDSHRIEHLMTGLGAPSPGRSVWIYRSWEGRIRSVLALWPENNRRVLSEIAAGVDRWEAGGLTPETLELIRSFDYDRLSQASGAALLWYARNSLFFDLGLKARDDVALVSYERFLDDPERSMRGVCEFIGVPFERRMIERIGRRPPATAGDLDIDPRIRSVCDDLERRLNAELDARLGTR